MHFEFSTRGKNNSQFSNCLPRQGPTKARLLGRQVGVLSPPCAQETDPAAGPLPPLLAPLPGIGGGSSVDNIYCNNTQHMVSTGSTCCSLLARYWVRYLSVTFLNQTDLSYFILVRYPTSSLFILNRIGGEHFHNFYPIISRVYQALSLVSSGSKIFTNDIL